MPARARIREMRKTLEEDKTYIPPNDKTPSLMKQKMHDCSYCTHWGKIGDRYGCKKTAECEAEEENYNALRLYGSKIRLDNDRATRKYFEYMYSLLNLHIRSR